MNREQIWDKLQALRAALRKARPERSATEGLYPVPCETLMEEPRWQVVLEDGNRDDGTHVEVVTFATAADIEGWQRRPDAEIRGTGLSWRNAAPAKKKRAA